MAGASWTCANCGSGNTNPGPCANCNAPPATAGSVAATSPAAPLLRVPPPAMTPGTAAPGSSARPRSYLGPAFVVWLLYLLGYIGGVIGNVYYMRSANRYRRETGIAPRGDGCLVFLLITHLLIPVLLVGGLLTLKVLYDDDILSGSAAPVARQVSEELDRLGSILGLGRPENVQPDIARLLAPPPTPTPDPWIAAVNEAVGVLNHAPGLEQDLRAHQQHARQISEQIKLVEEARPLLATVEKMKATEIPIAGNAWVVFIRVLNEIKHDAGEGLDTLIRLLEEISALKTRLDGLPDLDPVIAATAAFRTEPSRARLAAMDEAMQRTRGGLASSDQELSGYLDQVDDVAGSLDRLQEGLLGVRSKYPELSELVRLIEEPVERVAVPIRDLQSSVREWHGQIESSVEVVDSIHRIVQAVGE